MAVVAPPPPDRAVNPKLYTLPAASTLHRLYGPSRFGATATGFRFVGPFVRFDHHQVLAGGKLVVQSRGIIYSALDLTGALVEQFGSCGGGEAGLIRYCGIVTNEPLYLLDLREDGALRAGTILGVCSQAHDIAQEWSRCFYESIDVYDELDGLTYPNAHNGDASVALYERAMHAMPSRAQWDIELRDRTYRSMVLPALSATSLPIRLI